MVRRAQILVFADFFRAIGDNAVTPQRYTALAIIGDNPGLLLSQLADVMGVARPGTTALVDFWESRDAVERRPVPGDRRAFGLHLTRSGRRAINQLHARVGQHDDALTECFSDTERATLMRLLRKFCRDAQARQSRYDDTAHLR